MKKLKNTFQKVKTNLQDAGQIAKDNIMLDKEERKTRFDKYKDKVITGFDSINKKEAYIRGQDELQSGFDLYWTKVQKIMLWFLILAGGGVIFKNFNEYLSTIVHLIKGLPALLVICYIFCICIYLPISIYKKFAKPTMFKVQTTCNNFLDITIRYNNPKDYTDKTEWKAYIIAKTQAELVKHPQWKEFINSGFKWYRQKRFSDNKLLPIIEVAYGKYHKNSYIVRENKGEENG